MRRSINKPLIMLCVSFLFLVTSCAPTLKDRAGGKLVAWWKLDETSGTTASDSSGNGHTGTLQGNPNWQGDGGRIKGALKFDGTDDYIDVDYIGKFDAMTISLWVNIDSLPNIFNSLLHCDGWDRSDLHFMILNDGRVRFSVGGNRIRNPKLIDGWWFEGVAPTQATDQNSNYTFTSDDFGEWHHIAAVYDSSKRPIDFYIDGQSDVQRSYSRAGTVTVGPLRIGGWDSQGGSGSYAERYFDGRIDDVRIYSYALTEAEIKVLYAGKEGSGPAED